LWLSCAFRLRKREISGLGCLKFQQKTNEDSREAIPVDLGVGREVAE
jgi:hypothetical protein